MLTSHVAPVQVPAVLVVIQLPANALGKAVQNGPSAWAPAPGVTWLHPGHCSYLGSEAMNGQS